ncbi:unnamed protein product [Phyllotreta striolata]|uniref:Carboxylic ester hydrolase n=1 Tax=Phyllotreta striolata TaxID=444603 RepID=A0A9N9TFM5_PHYSR|nr:unnamed protein product [Phyllotreta striolata]
MIRATCIICLLGVFALTNAQRVTIPNGVIQGRHEYSQRGIKFFAFQQIPFAEPPIGPLRFRDPVPAKSWSGVLDATKNDRICYQQIKSPGVSLENEDCLYLNVYTPVEPSTNQSLPVMFYIFGGGFVNGTSHFDIYGPHYWMEQEVVVVTVSYRVGPFGFLSTGDLVIPGNYGLKDQLLGLKWVRDNIKYFGGDPAKVTIFGQSAGGDSVTYQMMSSKSKGLFRAGISQSGSVLCPWGYQRHHKDLAYDLASFVNPNFNRESSSEELLSYLQSVPARDLNSAAAGDYPQIWYDNQMAQGFTFTPTIEPEHENAFITERMYEALESGHMQKVPLMIGICSEELIWNFSDMESFSSWAQAIDNNLTYLVNDNMGLTDDSSRKEAGAAIRRIYTNTSFYEHPGKLVQFFSDNSFGRGIIHHAKVQSKFSDVYFYQFSYIGSMPGQHPYVPEANRVAHSDDNSYLWVYHNNSNLNQMPPGDILTSERLRILFSNFAKYLDPVHDGTDILGIESWPKLEPNNFQYLDINETLTIKKDLKKDVHDGWVDVYEKLAVKPFDTF